MKYTVALEFQNKRGILPTIFTSKKKAIEYAESWLKAQPHTKAEVHKFNKLSDRQIVYTNQNF